MSEQQPYETDKLANAQSSGGCVGFLVGFVAGAFTILMNNSAGVGSEKIDRSFLSWTVFQLAAVNSLIYGVLGLFAAGVYGDIQDHENKDSQLGLFDSWTDILLKVGYALFVASFRRLSQDYIVRFSLALAIGLGFIASLLVAVQSIAFPMTKAYSFLDEWLRYPHIVVLSGIAGAWIGYKMARARTIFE